jgi:hypothetical protein
MLKEWPDHLFSPRTAEAIVEPHGGLDCLRPPLYNTFFTLRIFDYSRAVCLLDCQSHVQNLRRPGPPFPSLFLELYLGLLEFEKSDGSWPPS